MSDFVNPDLLKPANGGALSTKAVPPADNIIEMPITVDLVPANDGPSLVDVEMSVAGAVYGRFADGSIRVFDEVDLQRPANDQLPPAVGLSGFAQTGKTTVAGYIESKYGYKRRHIAEPLRAMLRTLLQRFGMADELITRYLTGDLKESVIPCLGVTSRHAQITIGTEWGRDLIDQNLWARLWAHEAKDALTMNDSVRFPNEERAIQDELGGFTILVQRPGTRPAAFKWGKLGAFLYDRFGLLWGVHPSERIDLLRPSYVITNDGTLEELFAKVDDVFETEGVFQSLKP